jgi:hypothetical protein
MHLTCLCVLRPCSPAALLAVNVAAKTPSSDNCKPGCISLNFLAGLAGLDSTCICLTNTINHVQQGLHATQQVRSSPAAAVGVLGGAGWTVAERGQQTAVCSHTL